MDLLAPCRSCLECLPFFHFSPPPSPQREIHLQKDEGGSTPTIPVQVIVTETSVKETVAAASENQETLVVSEDPIVDGKAINQAFIGVRSGDDFASEVVVPTTATPQSEIIIAAPVSGIESSSLLTEEVSVAASKNDRPCPIPFINDVDFSTSGLNPPPSPATPAPFGTGYAPATPSPDHEKHDHHNHVQKQQKNNHGHDHGGAHGHGHTGHGHKHPDHSPKNPKSDTDEHSHGHGVDHLERPDHVNNNTENHHPDLPSSANDEKSFDGDTGIHDVATHASPDM